MALKEKDMTTYYIKERIRFATWVLQRVEPTEMTRVYMILYYIKKKKKFKFANWTLQRMEPTEGHYIVEL